MASNDPPVASPWVGQTPIDETVNPNSGQTRAAAPSEGGGGITFKFPEPTPAPGPALPPIEPPAALPPNPPPPPQPVLQGQRSPWAGQTPIAEPPPLPPPGSTTGTGTVGGPVTGNVAAVTGTPGASATATVQPNVQPYKGSVLPFSVDAQGKTHFDLSAGLPGSLWNALTLPGDITTGKALTPYTTGPDGKPLPGVTAQPSPEVLQRTSNLAGWITPRPPSFEGVPSAPTLKSVAQTQYDQAIGSDLRIAAPAVHDMATGLQSDLNFKNGVLAEQAPKTFGILNKLINPPDGSYMTPAALDAARQGLNRIRLEGGTGSTEGFAAGQAVQRLDSFLENLNSSQMHPSNAADPQAVSQLFANARGNYAAAQQSNRLTGSLTPVGDSGILDKALGRAESTSSGMNLDNIIRQRVNTILGDPKLRAGFTDDQLQMLEDVRSGAPGQNVLRWVSNILGGGGGVGHLATSAVGMMAGGASEHGLLGAAIGGLGLPAIGMALKTLENNLARTALQGVDRFARSNSPLGKQMLQQGAYPNAPLLPGGTARTLYPSLLAPSQPTPTSPGTIPESLLGGIA